MLTNFNGQERTLKHAIDLFLEVGWKVEKIKQFDSAGFLPSTFCAVPV